MVTSLDGGVPFLKIGLGRVEEDELLSQRDFGGGNQLASRRQGIKLPALAGQYFGIIRRRRLRQRIGAMNRVDKFGMDWDS